MGLLKTALFVVTPAVAYGCYSAVVLGSRLPAAARRTGQRLGMSYNYFRSMVKVMAPEDETAMKLLSVYRKSNQQVKLIKQVNALTREFSDNVHKIGQEASAVIPEEITKSPFEKFMLKDDEPVISQNVVFY